MHTIHRFDKKEAEGKSLFTRRRSKLNCNVKINLKEIEKGLNITPVLDKIQVYGRNWIQSVKRMPRNILQRMIRTTEQKAAGNRGDH
jgi:hypothetical protein